MNKLKEQSFFKFYVSKIAFYVSIWKIKNRVNTGFFGPPVKFDSGLRHLKMPYLCGFADSMLQKVSKKVSKQKGGALELYSSIIKRE